jgi:acetyl esterase
MAEGFIGGDMLDKHNEAVVAGVKEAGLPPMYKMTPQALRELTAAQISPQPNDEMLDLLFDVSGGVLSARIVLPRHAVNGVILFLPGGGWMLNSKWASHAMACALSEASSCAVVLAEYRLAPEYRFPTAVDDAAAALDFVACNIDKIAGRAVPLIIAGESAGGNLAAVVAARARDSGGPSLAAQILIYPVTDCGFNTASFNDPENQLILDCEAVKWLWDNYVPVLNDRVHPDVSPLRRQNLDGLPPAIVITAEHDVLRDEGELYAARLRAEGVPVYQRRFDGQMHGFFSMGDALPAGKEAVAYVAEAVTTILATDQSSPVDATKSA